MNITITLPDKIYEEIGEMCKLNNISIEEYVFNSVLDNFNILKYGDLNEKIESKKIKEEIPKENTEKKKVGRPRKKKEETDSLTLISETIEKGPNQPVINNNIEEFEKVFLGENKEQPKTIKRTRILKSK